MQKKMTSRERSEEKRLLSDIITGKITVVFFALFAAVLLLVRANGRSIDVWLATSARLWICLALGLLTAAALVWCILSVRRGEDNRHKVVSAPLVLGMAAVLFFVMLLYPALGAVLAIVYLFAAALLFFVYEIYPIDFFLFSAVTEFGALMIPLVSGGSLGSKKMIGNLLAVLASAAVGIAATFFVYKLQKNGKLKFGKFRIRRPQGMMAFTLPIGTAIALAGVLGTWIFGYALYFAFGVCAAYLVVAIIYTVKLM